MKKILIEDGQKIHGITGKINDILTFSRLFDVAKAHFPFHDT